MKGRILTSLLTVIVLTGLQAQNVPAVPKLVVGLPSTNCGQTTLKLSRLCMENGASNGCGRKAEYT